MASLAHMQRMLAHLEKQERSQLELLSWKGPGARRTDPSTMPGQRFGRLLVLRRGAKNSRGCATWLCVCDCGSERLAETNGLKSGCIKSCGCLRREQLIKRNTKHGDCNSPEHRSWMGMIQRCTNPKDAAYDRYGGRGINVHPEWKSSFTAFLDHVGRRPTRAHSLDRIDNDRGYEPGNVRWATAAEQNRNQRSNIRITFAGETMILTDWAKRIGIPVNTLYSRITHLGWTLDEALKPKMRKRRASWNAGRKLA